MLEYKMTAAGETIVNSLPRSLDPSLIFLFFLFDWEWLGEIETLGALISLGFLVLAHQFRASSSISAATVSRLISNSRWRCSISWGTSTRTRRSTKISTAGRSLGASSRYSPPLLYSFCSYRRSVSFFFFFFWEFLT